MNLEGQFVPTRAELLDSSGKDNPPRDPRGKFLICIALSPHLSLLHPSSLAAFHPHLGVIPPRLSDGVQFTARETVVLRLPGGSLACSSAAERRKPLESGRNFEDRAARRSVPLTYVLVTTKRVNCDDSIRAKTDSEIRVSVHLSYFQTRRKI